MQVYRSTSRNRVFSIVAAAAGLVSVVFAVAFALMPLVGRTDEPIIVLWSPAFAAAAFVGFRWAKRAWSARVVVEAEAVVVHGPWATRRFPLSDVKHFRPGLQAGHGMNPTPGVVLELVDKGTVSLWTLASEGLVWNNDRKARAWTATADALNAELDQRRAHA